MLPDTRSEIPRCFTSREGPVLPGLADMHVHLEFKEPTVLLAFLANGVSTVRNMDGRPYILDWKRRIARGG